MSEVQNSNEAVRGAVRHAARDRALAPEKAVEFPDDARNLGAAETLERLASTVSEIHPMLRQRWSEHWSTEEISSRLSEFQSEVLRRSASSRTRRR